VAGGIWAANVEEEYHEGKYRRDGYPDA